MLMIKKIGFVTVLRVLADDCPLATISRDAVEPFARVRQVRPLPLKRGFLSRCGLNLSNLARL